MALDELMLLHGCDPKTGGCDMAGFTTYYDSRSRTFKRRRKGGRRRRSTGGIGTFGAGFGSMKSVKSTLKGFQGVIVTGAIAAGGVVITDAVYDKIGGKLGLSGWQRELAKLATGFAIAIVVGKLLKKPRLGAAIAVGPAVAAFLRIFADVLHKEGMSGLGLTTIQPAAIPQFAMGNMGSLEQYGGPTPYGMQFPGAKPRSYAVAGMGG